MFADAAAKDAALLMPQQKTRHWMEGRRGNRKHGHSIYLVSHNLHLAERPAPDNLDGFEAVSCEPARLDLLDYLGVWSRAQANKAA